MRQLDSDIGDLDSFIKDTENLIKSELEDDILDSEGELRSTFSALAELDCILSLTSCAADLNFTRPEIVQGNSPVIYIENGRHPLQELIIEGAFIKNDTMVDEENRVNIITGSNFSGKSCYTRQVGVLVYLAHIGSFLPCDRAKISITDQILARISSVETCAVPQSSFQLDLTQMAVILRQSTPKTLVLIDEFGKGTAPASGKQPRLRGESFFHFVSGYPILFSFLQLVCLDFTTNRNRSANGRSSEIVKHWMQGYLYNTFSGDIFSSASTGW